MARISKAQLIKLQKKFTTDEKIGELYGISRQAVHQLRTKYGIDSSLADNPQRNATIVKLYRAGTTGIALGEKFAMSASHIYRIVHEAKAGRRQTKKRKR
jgi:CRISPR/Cas system-associated exonuclease Cas4 (RecB family)